MGKYMSISNAVIKFICVSAIAVGTFFGALEWKLQSANGQRSASQDPQTGPTIGLGSRGDCPALSAGVPDLTALTPDKNEDTVTLSQSPTFRFYSPYPNAKYRLRLFAMNKRDLLYRQDLTGSNKIGIFAVSLKNVAALETKERYFWELEYFCSNKPQAANPIVSGYLYRDELTASQKQEFSSANTSAQRIDFYRRNGIWIELLDEIAKSLPQSQTVWQQTLDAEGLQSISKQPLLPTE
jgi:hypothetical protein